MAKRDNDRGSRRPPVKLPPPRTGAMPAALGEDKILMEECTEESIGQKITDLEDAWAAGVTGNFIDRNVKEILACFNQNAGLREKFRDRIDFGDAPVDLNGTLPMAFKNAVHNPKGLLIAINEDIIGDVETVKDKIDVHYNPAYDPSGYGAVVRAFMKSYLPEENKAENEPETSDAPQGPPAETQLRLFGEDDPNFRP